MWSLGSVKVMWGLGNQLEKSDEVVTAVLRALSSSGKRETRHQLLTSLHRDLQQNHDTVDRVGGGENEETYIDGLDANDVKTDTPT